jgi:G3E family GTPase
LKDAGVNITEMNSGCICCSLVGDFSKALRKVMDEYAPERIIIEPSGVGKLSDVAVAVERANLKGAQINALCAVVDAGKCKMYMKNFGEFFNDQIRSASCIVMSHADKCSEEKLAQAVALVKEQNSAAVMVTTPLTQLSGKDILNAMEQKDSLTAELEQLRKEHEEHEHEHHHHHDHDDDDDDEDEHEHCHHHHDHDDDDDDEDEHEHCHHHHHDDDDDEDEHEHEHEHHHHHHADDVFTSWGVETTHKFTETELKAILEGLGDEKKYGVVLRAKGIVDCTDGDGKWIHFDYVPEEPDIRKGIAGVTGRLCVIGCQLNEAALKELFKA